jgi:glycolate oxidase
MCTQFDRPTLETFFGVKRAFDPDGTLNPGKVVPTLHRCAESGRTRVHAGAARFPALPRF